MLTPDFNEILKECRFTAVRSSGKGGQNVNKVSTKVLLEFDVLNSSVLDDEQKAWITLKLLARISKEGILHMTCSTERTQLGNKELVQLKFLKVLEKAFLIPEKRIPTRPSAGSRERRLKDKKLNAERKSGRGINAADFPIDG